MLFRSQKQQRLGHLCQVELRCPLFVANTFALCHFLLNVHQQLEGLLFGLFFLVRLVLRLSLQHRLDLVLAITGTQCAETDKAFLSLAFHRRVLATLDLITLLFQFLQKIFVILGLFCKDAVDDATQPITIAFFGWIEGTFLPF